MAIIKWRNKQLLCTTLAGAMLLLSFNKEERTPSDKVKAVYAKHLQQFKEDLATFRENLYTATDSTRKIYFTTCRTDYKYLEYAIEYHYPYVAKRINGAALPETEPGDVNEVILPTGLQVLEEYIYGENPGLQKEWMRKQLDFLLLLTGKLQEEEATLHFTIPSVYDAIRLNLYRLASKGISGFDSPVARQSLSEAVTTLASAEEVLTVAGPVTSELKLSFARSKAMLHENDTDFNSFNRAKFLVSYYNPLLQALHNQQKKQHIDFVHSRSAVKRNAVSFLATNAFDPYFFAEDSCTVASAALAQLGEKLFREKTLSLGGRSCVGCHLPAKAYTDGFRVNHSLQREDSLKRNTPTLLNAALQPDLFFDGRVHSLEAQIKEVLANRDEMASDMKLATAALKQNTYYQPAFTRAFPKDRAPVTEANICKAIAAYVRTLVRLNSRFDRFMRGDTTLLTSEEQHGFNLFMGKAKCGTCHYMPLFNGAIPPLYDREEGEVLGVPASTASGNIDSDPGMYFPLHIRKQEHAFNTPTVRNAALTAPYMHNGIFRTLDEVIDFYDKGGGAGLGQHTRNQTLPEDKLHLTQQEKQALIAFIRSLNDA
ncbi:cytochrome-c peroxidase [Chitinophagaceae bacterium MMS25-I14]